MRKWISSLSLAVLLFAEAFVPLFGAAELPAGPPAYVLLNVPFYPDDTDQCGPSTLASVLAYWGKPTDPAKLKDEVYLASLKGTLSMDMALASRRHGLKAKITSASLEEIKSELTSHHPAILFINQGTSFYPLGHYLVVTGYDEDRGGFYVHSGKQSNKFISYRRLMKGWEKTDRWALLTEPRPVESD